MFPLPIISNTNINSVPQIQLLENEISSFNMFLNNSTFRISSVPQPLGLCYMRGTSLVLSSQINGSPYGYQCPTDTVLNSVFVHCFPDERIYNFYKNNPTLPSYIYLTDYDTYNNYPSVTRNNLTSIGYFKNYAGARVVLFVYYDSDTGYVMQYNPHLMTEPERRFI